MKVVLYSPDIPQNVGSIARTCAATNSTLVLVRPIRFSLSSRQMKRSGLDYWQNVHIEITDTLEEAISKPVYFFSTKASQPYSEICFDENACLVFGSESSGLPTWVHEKWASHFYTIPMHPQSRSLNLSNSVSIVLYEGLRQQNFTTLQKPSCVSHLNL